MNYVVMMVFLIGMTDCSYIDASQVEAITYLDFSDGKVESEQDLEEVKTAVLAVKGDVHLNLSRNNLKNLPYFLPKNQKKNSPILEDDYHKTRIVYLDFSYNNLPEVAYGDFNHPIWCNLKKLDLGNNPICGIDRNVLANLPILEKLYVDSHVYDDFTKEDYLTREQQSSEEVGFDNQKKVNKSGFFEVEKIEAEQKVLYKKYLFLHTYFSYDYLNQQIRMQFYGRPLSDYRKNRWQDLIRKDPLLMTLLNEKDKDKAVTMCMESKKTIPLLKSYDETLLEQSHFSSLRRKPRYSKSTGDLSAKGAIKNNRKSMTLFYSPVSAD